MCMNVCLISTKKLKVLLHYLLPNYTPLHNHVTPKTHIIKVDINSNSHFFVLFTKQKIKSKGDIHDTKSKLG